MAKLAGSPRELEPDVDSTPNMCHFAGQTRSRLRRPVECAPVGGQRHAAVLTRRWAC
jgi:hypothetical protein